MTKNIIQRVFHSLFRALFRRQHRPVQQFLGAGRMQAQPCHECHAPILVGPAKFIAVRGVVAAKIPPLYLLGKSVRSSVGI